MIVAFERLLAGAPQRGALEDVLEPSSEIAIQASRGRWARSSKRPVLIEAIVVKNLERLMTASLFQHNFLGCASQRFERFEFVEKELSAYAQTRLR